MPLPFPVGPALPRRNLLLIRALLFPRVVQVGPVVLLGFPADRGGSEEGTGGTGLIPASLSVSPVSPLSTTWTTLKGLEYHQSHLYPVKKQSVSFAHESATTLFMALAGLQVSGSPLLRPDTDSAVILLAQTSALIFGGPPLRRGFRLLESL
jgi:hypothetical protein